ncbi:hypothetical protein OH77DRAFT_1423029 [Trametes cingulata]|nr:hypothetical protein OH77DRAFT_1423029 [Trametes cingulata]
MMRAHSTQLFMLCCGALVNTPEAFRSLKDNFETLGIPRLLAFGAAGLQAALTVAFFINFVQKILIENVNFTDAQLGNLLSLSANLGRHTKVLVMSSDPTGPSRSTTAVYSWSHPTIRPWGELIDAQCGLCKRLFCLKAARSPDGSAYITTCRTAKCEYRKVTHRPPGTQTLNPAEGTWLKQIIRDD